MEYGVIYLLYRTLLTSPKERAEKRFHHQKRGESHYFQKCRLGTMSGSTSRLRATVASVCRKMPRELRNNLFLYYLFYEVGDKLLITELQKDAERAEKEPIFQ